LRPASVIARTKPTTVFRPGGHERGVHCVAVGGEQALIELHGALGVSFKRPLGLFRVGSEVVGQGRGQYRIGGGDELVHGVFRPDIVLINYAQSLTLKQILFRVRSICLFRADAIFGPKVVEEMPSAVPRGQPAQSYFNDKR
jgi:hypothetical protein